MITSRYKKYNDVRDKKTEETLSNRKENLEEKYRKTLDCDVGERILEKLIGLRKERAEEEGKNQNITGE